ncbi:MAG TPA: 1,2-phenylacetyl-CoA epoxidase subunit PaaC [Chitinophagales bacterium]|nr:1,2-phenylacetyl-CoA epoxidase subunit PaaC [Chitinophagales bacterium]
MQPVEELMLKMADDALIIGHRNSEWTGLGPILEEDIAFSSMAQDKIGHALALYKILHEQFGEPDSDLLAFHRGEKDFKCCHLVEFPIGEYDFTTARHFLFDNAEILRYELLLQSSFEPLARLAKKIHGELKYHLLHANSWFTRLGRGTEESHARMQSALNSTYPLAPGIFEASPFEKELIELKVFPGEKVLHEMWEEKVHALIGEAHLQIPSVKDATIGMGGRNGYHTEHLQPLLNEMSEVFRLEENVEW